MSEWMSGEVCDILPYGLRVRKLPDTCRSKFYIIPSRQIPAHFWTRLSELIGATSEVGLGLKQANALVQFQAAHQPCSDEATGDQRAKAVQFVDFKGLLPEMGAPCVEQFPPPLPQCPVMMAAADEWQRRAEGDLESLNDSLHDLEESLEHGRLMGDGNKISNIFCSCAAGVHVVLDSQAWYSRFGGRCPLALAPLEFQSTFARLLKVCIFTLSALDPKIFFHSIKLALSFCGEVAHHFFQRREWPIDLQVAWRDIAESAARLKLRRNGSNAPKRSVSVSQRARFQCSVSGCLRNCRRWVLKDVHGVSAWRCKVHSPKSRCNVVGCLRAKTGMVSEADIYGLAGGRCSVHGGRNCNVLNCKRFARYKALEVDKFGSAGRCRFRFWHRDFDVFLYVFASSRIFFRVDFSHFLAGKVEFVYWSKSSCQALLDALNVPLCSGRLSPYRPISPTCRWSWTCWTTLQGPRLWLQGSWLQQTDLGKKFRGWSWSSRACMLVAWRKGL